MRPSLLLYLRHVSACLLLLSAAASSLADTATTSETNSGLQAKTSTQQQPGALDKNEAYVNFSESPEVDQFLDDMVSKHGFERAALNTLFSQMRHIDSAIQLMKPAPPGKPKNWQAYRRRFVEPVRISAGVRFWNDNADALARAQKEYGVPADIIVAIIGVETVYGRVTGNFRVLDALATLAFDYPETPTRKARMAFFRGELESALLISREQAIDPLSLLGSYAGAIGLPQFMPSSIIQYAVDFDGDGQIDLRNSTQDAIGSVAHFLSMHGWQRNDPGALVYAAQVSPEQAWKRFIDVALAATVSQNELRDAGVSTDLLLPPDMLFGLVNLQNGLEATEYWLGTNNFFAITHYNRSYFYAMSVIDLARAIKLAGKFDLEL
jgi:membrane-bound lytic murein transglycosylase B